MTSPKPYEAPETDARVKTFRARKSSRYVLAAVAGVGVAVLIAMTALSIYWLLDAGDPFFSLFTGLYFSPIGVGLFIVAITGYWAIYWWKYTIVVDDEKTAREGWLHPVDRKKQILHSDVFQVTHGARNVLKIVPKEGAPLAVGLKGLEGEPTALIEALRERIPDNRFESNLEAEIFENRSSDRLGYLIGGFLIAGMLLALGGLWLRDFALERTAWIEISGIEDTQRISLIDADDSGSVWMISEGSFREQDEPLNLTHIRADGQVESVDLTNVPILKEPLDLARNAGPFPVDSMAIDSQNRPWIVFRDGRSAFAWDGSEWIHVPAIIDEVDFEITDLTRIGDYLWARVPEQNSLFRINTNSMETAGMGPLSWEQDDATLEFKPFNLRGTSDSVGVLFGEFSQHGPGFIVLGEDGEFGYSSAVLNAPRAMTWRPRSATPDDDGRIHLVYHSRDVCVANRRLIKIGTAQANTPWFWRDLVYEADCGVDPIHDEIRVDLEGRVWIKPNDGEVFVFSEPSEATDGSDSDPLAVYTTDNSGFNDGKLVVGSNGQVFGVQGWKSDLVALDARGAEIPAPLPAWIAWLLEYPYVPQFASFIVILPLLVVLAKRNFGR